MIKASGVAADEVRIKALVAALDGVDIATVAPGRCRAHAATAAAAPAAASPPPRAQPRKKRLKRTRKQLRRAAWASEPSSARSPSNSFLIFFSFCLCSWVSVRTTTEECFLTISVFSSPMAWGHVADRPSWLPGRPHCKESEGEAPGEGHFRPDPADWMRSEEQ